MRYLMSWIFGYHHRNRSRIFQNRQWCNDCGQSRTYVIGERPGKWEK